MNRPLLTFVVASYNQEEYIAEAVRSALAQTYSPLEIIVSDDCSRDRSFVVASEITSKYKGPHTVRLNRNLTNLGIGGHANRLMELSRGKLLVASAGDDVSTPNRVETIYQAWEESDRQATSIFSSYRMMSDTGEVQEVGGLRGEPGGKRRFQTLEGNLFDYLSKKAPVVSGCTHAWSAELFSYFGPVISDLADLVLSFRTLAIGKLVYIDEPLVNYRRHESNVSFLAERDDTRSFEHRERRLRWVDEKSVLAYDNMLGDIATLLRKERITVAEHDRLRAEARRIRSRYAVEREMMDGGFIRRLVTLVGTLKQGQVRCAVRALPRALPRRIYRALYLMRARWRTSMGAGQRA